MRFRYLIWDFDGTLFDTYPVLNRSIRRALAEFGVESDEERIAAMLSDTLSDTIDALAREHDLDVETFVERIRHHQAEASLAERPPFPGAIRVCRRFLKAGGTNYIHTHRDTESLMAYLDFQGVVNLFADCVTRDDGYPRKPDPAGFAALVEKHNLPKAEVLAVGDRDLDVLGAHAAGLAACLFGTEPGPGVEPEYVIHDFGELERILGLETQT